MLTSHSETCRGFAGPCGQFTSCINISCLEVAVCLSVSASYEPTTAHAFWPSSSCSLFTKVTSSTLVWGLGGWRAGEHSGHPLPSLPYTHLDDWYSLQLPLPLQLTTLSAGCGWGMGGGQSWTLRIWAHQYTHHLLFFCITLNINTIRSLHKDNVKLTSFLKWYEHVLAFIFGYESYFFPDSWGFKVFDRNPSREKWSFGNVNTALSKLSH